MSAQPINSLRAKAVRYTQSGEYDVLVSTDGLVWHGLGKLATAYRLTDATTARALAHAINQAQLDTLPPFADLT